MPKANLKSGVDGLASIVNALTIPILWLTITDALHSIYAYRYNGTNANLLVVASAGAIVAWVVSKCCRNLMAPPSQKKPSGEDFEKDQLYLQRALSASLTGVLLIVLEPMLEPYMATGFRFRFEELLLASSGLNSVRQKTP